MTMENAYEKELRKTYFFGDPDSTSSLRDGREIGTVAMRAMNTNAGSAAFNQVSSAVVGNSINYARDSDNDDNNNNDFTPRDNYDNVSPASPGAFGPSSDGTANPSAKASSAAQENNGNAARGDHKKHVVKEVLGLNRKSTRGKTDEEKNQIQIEQRWKNALAEERRLQELEERVATGEMQTARVRPAPNFPPKFLCIKPLVYHDIDAVPPQRQRFVRVAFWNWVAVSILLVVNAVVAIAVPYAPFRNHEHSWRDINKAKNDVLAIVYLIGIPLAFILWYWRVYNACSNGSPGEHIVAICGLLIALGQGIFAFIGPTSCGVCGIMLAQEIGKTRQSAVVAPVVIVLVLWFAEICVILFLLWKQYGFYRRDLAARRELRRTIPAVIG